MDADWFFAWLRDHLDRHMASNLPAVGMASQMYAAWKAEFEHHGITERAATLASIRLVSRPPAKEWHFKSLMKAARELTEKQRAEPPAPPAPYVEPIPAGGDLLDCIKTARGDGIPAKMMRSLLRRLISENKLDIRHVPYEAWEERDEPVQSGLKRVPELRRGYVKARFQ
jgi:hypothetical protein